MTSALALKLAIICTVLGTILTGTGAGFSFWAVIVSAKEGKRDLDDATDRVISEQKASRDEILMQLRDIEILNKNVLTIDFPYGYILFGVRTGDNIIHLPFKTGKAEIAANWNAVKISIDPRNKKIKLSIPSYTFAIPGENKKGIYGSEVEDWESSYTLGKPIPINVLKVIGQEPNLYFEVLNDERDAAQVALGLK